MDKEMFLFYRNALAKNLCSSYKKEWNKRIEDNKLLYEFSLNTGAIPYIATATYRGWGLTKDLIHKEFGEYINGKYIIKNSNGVEGATATSYYDYHFNNEIIENSLIATYWCNGNVKIKDYGCSRFHISNDSNLHFNNGKNVILWLNVYDNSVVNIGDIKIGDSIYVVKYSDSCVINYKDMGGKIIIRNRDVDIDAFYEIINND